MSAIHELTATSIRTRLEALQEAETAHADRDLARELADAIAQGADVDAIEAQHLEAERQARRHHAERIALETALPLAMAREGTAAIEALHTEHNALQSKAIKVRDKILRAAEELETTLSAWAAVQTSAVNLDRQARAASQAAGIKPERISTFTSAQVSALPGRLIGRLHELALQDAQRIGPSMPIDNGAAADAKH